MTTRRALALTAATGCALPVAAFAGIFAYGTLRRITQDRADARQAARKVAVMADWDRARRPA